MELQDALDEYLYHNLAKGFSKKTMINKRQEFGKFASFLKERRGITELETITTHDTKAYIRAAQLSGLQASSIVTKMKMISAFFNWCIQEEYLTESPMKKVEQPKQQRKVLEGFTSKEVIKMIDTFTYKDYIEVRNKAIIAMLADTGIRAGELCGLRTDNIKDTNILIDGKGNKQRFVFISPSLKKILIRYERIKEHYFSDKIIKSDCYFLNYQGDKLSHPGLWNAVKEAGERTGIKHVHPHKFRHFFSVSFIKNGGDIYTLSRLLGHSDVGTTQRYLRSMTSAELESKAISSSPLMNLSE